MLCSAEEIEEKKRQAKLKLAKKKNLINSPNLNNAISKNFSKSAESRSNPQPSTSFNRHNRVITGTLFLISESRFEVRLSRFSEAAREVFRLIPSKMYDYYKKIWNFHINDYDLFQSQMKVLYPDVVVDELPNHVLNGCKTPKPDYSKINLGTTDLELPDASMPIMTIIQEEDVSESKEEVVTLNPLSETKRICLKSLSDAYAKEQNGPKQGAALRTYFAETGKIKIPSVCSYILEILETSKKFIIIAHHKKMLNAIEHVLVKKNRQFIRIDGSYTSTQRKTFVDKFQEDDSYQCALLSITAATSGITLTAAQLVIFAELHWNPSILNQAESCVQIIGQDPKVHVVYLLAPDTADDYIWPILKDKQKILRESSNFESTAKHLSVTLTSAHTLDISSYFNTPNKRSLSDPDCTDALENKTNKIKRRLSFVDELDDQESLPSSQDIFENISSIELDFLDDDFDEVLSNVKVPE